MLAANLIGPIELFWEQKFEEHISVGSLFPSLQGSQFDAVNLTNTSMVWLGKDASRLKKVGLWFETDFQPRGMLQPAADILLDVFEPEKPGIHLSAHLGIQEQWTDELIATGFTFRGSIEGMDRGFVDFLTFRIVGIMINIAPGKKGQSETLWIFYGKLHLNVPNSVVSFVLNYNLESKTDSMGILWISETESPSKVYLECLLSM